MKRLLPCAVLAGAVLALPGAAQADSADYGVPHAPYRVAGNVDHVGTKGIGVYLIATPKGHILLDGSTVAGAAVVEANIKALGFRLKDVKYIVETHAHWDHVGGLAKLKADTGAQLIASAGDRYGLEHGVHVGDNSSGPGSFPAVKVDRVIGGGGTVSVGGVSMVAHMTPGHTRGCTTWTLDIKDHGIARRVLFFGSTTTAGNVLVGNKTYPNIVADYRLSFRRLHGLRADILLTNHPEMADMESKYQAQTAGKADAFVDANALPALVAATEADFNAELKRQESVK